MIGKEHSTHLQTELKRLEAACQGSRITFGELCSAMSHKNQTLLIFILSLPFLLPIPLPGLSVPFGLLIAWTSLRMFFGKSLWLPSFIRLKTVSAEQIKTLLKKAEPIAQYFSRWVKPRGKLFLRASGTKHFSLLLVCTCGILLALPLPPGTNSPPAFTAALLSLGILEEDSLFVGLGYFCFFLITILFGALIFWGTPHVIHWFGY